MIRSVKNLPHWLVIRSNRNHNSLHSKPPNLLHESQKMPIWSASSARGSCRLKTKTKKMLQRVVKGRFHSKFVFSQTSIAVLVLNSLHDQRTNAEIGIANVHYSTRQRIASALVLGLWIQYMICFVFRKRKRKKKRQRNTLWRVIQKAIIKCLIFKPNLEKLGKTKKKKKNFLANDFKHCKANSLAPSKNSRVNE